MPIVTATPRGLRNGEVITEFTDTTSTTAVTYTYPIQQAGIRIENSGVADVYVTVGAYINQVVRPNKAWKADVVFSAFSIRSDVNSQEFVATAFQNDIEGSGETDLFARAMITKATEGMSFALAKNPTLGIFGSTEPRFLDNIGDGYLYGSNSRRLYRASSENGAWTLIKDFGTGDAVNGIRALGDGEVLVFRASDGLWKSTGWSTDPLTATWRQVLVTNGTVKQYSVDVDTVSGWVTATTYINGDMTNSRYVWLSQDNGETWTQIFDKVVAEPGLDPTHSHMHITVIDPYWNPTTPRIWISYHKTVDDPTNGATPVKRIKYSDNVGQTWVDFSNADYQPIVGIATPEGVLFGSDEEQVAMYIVRRTPVPSDMKYELFYAIRENIDGLFGWATKAIKGENGAYHMAFRSANVPGYDARVISTDGKQASETLRIPPATNSDTVDLVDIVEYKGKLLGVYYNTATGAGSAYKVVAEAPKRGVQNNHETLGNLLGGIAGPAGIGAGYNSKSDLRASAVGFNTIAKRDGVAIGCNANTEIEGVAIGKDASVTTNGVAEGYQALAAEGVSVGRKSTSAGDGISIGSNTISVTESSAVGAFADGSGAQSVAIGKISKATGTNSVAVGAQSQATGTGSTALGRGAKSIHDHAVVFGWGNTSTASNQFHIAARHIEGKNISNPSSAPVGGFRLFSRLNGTTGKTELCVLFPTGSPIVIATEL